jgi:hypothetical protein
MINYYTHCIRVWDNGGRTNDRYTVSIDGDCYGMSTYPMTPNGFNQHISMERALDSSALGKELDKKDIPYDVWKAIKHRVSHNL